MHITPPDYRKIGQKHFASILVFLVFVFYSVPLLGQDRSSEKKEPLWWETLAWGLKSADQSTAPAPDLLPYDWIKENANDHIVGPTQSGFDDIEPNKAIFEYDPKTNLVQRLGREETMRALQNNRKNNYVYSQAELADQPVRGDPIGGRDYAPTGGKIKPIRAPRQSFSQAATLALQNQLALGPYDIMGIKFLDTLQATQHLIDCQAKGHSASECFKQYGVSFAMSKAVTELLRIVGQKLGWHLVKDAALGELVVGGGFMAGYLAYADYLAIQEIMALGQVKIDEYGDKLANQRQAESNLGSDRFNWSGSIPELKTRVDLFKQHFDAYMVAAGDELFGSWAESKEALSKAKASRKKLNSSLEEFLSPEKLQAELEAECDKTVQHEVIESLESLRGRIDRQIALIAKSVARANALAEKCSTEEEAESILAIHELLVGLEKDLKQALSEEKQLLKEVDKQTTESVKKRKAELIEEASLAEAAQATYEEFAGDFFTAGFSVWSTESAYLDYNSARKLYLARWRRLSQFLKSRAEDILVAQRLAKALSMLDETGAYLKSFQPKRMPFDSVSEYRSELNGFISDIQYMENVGVKLKEELNKRVQALEKVEVSCESEEDTADRDTNISSLAKQIAELPLLAKKCAMVKVPQLLGMTLSGALKTLKFLGLKAEPEENKETCLEQKNSNKVSHQVQEKGKKVRRGSEVAFVHWGPFDKSAKCKQLLQDIRNSNAEKNLEEARRLLKEMRSLACEDTNAAAGEISRAEQIQLDEKQIFLPRVTGYPLEKAKRAILDAGFKHDGNFDLEMIKTADYSKDKLVKQQRPPGDTYQTKGASVKLECWSFDVALALQGHKCSDVSGSRAFWNYDLNKAECVCPEATVEITLRKRGTRCAPCDEVKLYFDREMERGNKERAEKIRNLAKGRCMWDGQAEWALNQSRAEEQAADLCNQQIIGSVAVPVGGGKYRCDCPAGTVSADIGRQGKRCTPCNEMAGYFNKASARGDIKSASYLLGISKHCFWSKEGSQVLANLQQGQAAQQNTQRNAQLNKRQCDNLIQKITNACNRRQWMTFQSLLLRVNSFPGCRVPPRLFQRCNSMQMAQPGRDLAHIYKPPPYQFPSHAPPKPQRSQKPPQQTKPPPKPQGRGDTDCNNRSCSYCFRVTQRFTRQGKNPNCHWITYWCPYVPGGRSGALALAEKHKQQMRAQGHGLVYHQLSIDLIAGPSKTPIDSSKYGRGQQTCN